MGVCEILPRSRFNGQGGLELSELCDKCKDALDNCSEAKTIWLCNDCTIPMATDYLSDERFRIILKNEAADESKSD